MDTTECLGLPYPQCDPPLTKDASDIEQVRDLALAVDREVQELADAITHQLIRPDSCKMRNASALVSTLMDNTIVFDTVVWDNTDTSAMGDLTAGVIRIQRDGWYLIGSWATCSVATDVQMRVRFMVNGSPATNFQGPAGLAQPGVQNVCTEDMLFLREGDGVTVQLRQGAAPTSVSYVATAWVALVVPNV